MTEQEAIATILVNQRFMRNGSPPITNALDLLPKKLKDEVMGDAQAVIDGLKASRIAEPIAGTMEGWISVAERLPEDTQWVIVVASRGQYEQLPIVACYLAVKKQWVDWSHRAVTVTHWMPIPALPDVSDEKPEVKQGTVLLGSLPVGATFGLIPSEAHEDGDRVFDGELKVTSQEDPEFTRIGSGGWMKDRPVIVVSMPGDEKDKE